MGFIEVKLSLKQAELVQDALGRMIDSLEKKSCDRNLDSHIRDFYLNKYYSCIEAYYAIEEAKPNAQDM